MKLTHGYIGDVLALIQNGVNCKQNKSGMGEKITRIETIADSSFNYDKTGFAQLDEKQKTKAKLKVGDILFSHINSPIHVGKTAVYNGAEPLYHGINLLRLRTIKEVDCRYFNMFLVSLFQSGYWRRTAKQSVNQASVNQTDIKSVPFSYPPLAEQQRIVARLDATFSMIDRVVEAVNKQLRNSSNFFSTILTEKLNQIENNTKLGECCSFLNGYAFKSNDAVEETDVQLLRMGNLHNNVLDLGRKSVFYPSEFAQIYSSYTINSGDIVMTLTGTVGKKDYGYAVKVPETDKTLLLNQRILKLHNFDDSKVNQDFLLYVLHSQSFLRELYSTANGTRQANLSSETIKNLKIPLPNIITQNKLVRSLKSIELANIAYFEAINRKLAELLTLKSAILSKELQSTKAA